MNLGLIIFLSAISFCFGGSCYWISGPWGWSKKARILYGVSGMVGIGVLHFELYTGIANPNAPEEDPIKVFKQRSEFYKKWAALNRRQRFMYVTKLGCIWAAFFGCYLFFAFVVSSPAVHFVALFLMLSLSGTWLRGVLLRA